VKLVTLGADMLGNYVPCSLEALQDIGFMQAFLQNDISYAVLDAEEVAYTDVLLDATNGATHFTGSLTHPEDYLDMTVQPDRYDAGSAWLMPKRKAISLKKAQVAANQFNPFWTTVNGREYFHGYPVYHSTKLQDLGSPAADAVVFGNFNQGLIIGDRNNSAVLIKVDDITNFKQGIINIFGYRRSQALVRDRAALRSSVVL
jgi:HK97 family phage major capsid protein